MHFASKIVIGNSKIRSKSANSIKKFPYTSLVVVAFVHQHLIGTMGNRKEAVPNGL